MLRLLIRLIRSWAMDLSLPQRHAADVVPGDARLEVDRDGDAVDPARLLVVVQAEAGQKVVVARRGAAPPVGSRGLTVISAADA